MLTEKAAMYSTLGISKEVFAFGTKIEEELKERFCKIDEIAEYNQLKVIHAHAGKQGQRGMLIWNHRIRIQ